jgi:calcium-translocating P-type ATPase
MKIHQLLVDDALESVRSGPHGLSSAEARRRLAEYGLNQMKRASTASPLRQLLRQFTHFFAVILWVAAFLAFVAEAFSPGGGMVTLGVAIVGVIVVNGLFSFWQEHRAERAVAALQGLLPHDTQVVRDGQLQAVDVTELVPGDLVALGEGDTVPADCRLVEAKAVRVNTAIITGESAATARDAAPSELDDLLQARNVVLAGTSIVSGHATALVYATGMHTEFGRIAHLTQAAEEPLSPLQKEIARPSRVVAILAVALGLLFFLLGRLVGAPFSSSFLFAIGVIVANVPEGLLPTVTLSLAMASQRMARRNALVRHLPAVEALGAATVICTDKTGTLTQNRMEVTRVFAAGRDYRRESFESEGFLSPAHRPLFEVAALCENVTVVNRQGRAATRGDPMEVAITAFGRRGLSPGFAKDRVEELPFDSDRKRLSTLHRDGEDLVLYTKGATETVIPLCKRVLAADGTAHALTAEDADALQRMEAAMTDGGMRVLALAYRPVAPGYQLAGIEQDLILCGLVALEDPPRPEVPEAILKCRAAGIKVVMMTGDHPRTAEAIGREIGLWPPSTAAAVVTGEQMRRMSDIQLQLALDAPHFLFARVTPEQKMRVVRALRRKGHVVAATGDGVNDAPALREADVGVAMGQIGTAVAREAADLVLLDDNFASIVAAVEEGRSVFANIRKFLTYILSSNVPELVPYLAFTLFGIPLPLTVMQILAVDLGTDIVPALALGAEPPEAEVMQVSPRPRTERLLTVAVLCRSYLWLGAIEAVAAMAAFFYVLRTAGWRYGVAAPGDTVYRQSTTACLVAIVTMQLVNVFICRSEKKSAFAFGLRTSRLLLAGIGLELGLILLIVYTSPGHALFGTAPLQATTWIFIVPFALAMLVLEELRKLILKPRRALGRVRAAAPISAPRPA